MYRTDLAMESTRLHAHHLPPGVTQQEETTGALTVHTVTITDTAAANLLDKPIGRYSTLCLPPFATSDTPEEEELNHMARLLGDFLPEQGTILVVGLGNRDITPDAIGPQTAHQVLATRHLVAPPPNGDRHGITANNSDHAASQPQNALPPSLTGLRPTVVIAPGVLGQTGVEASEIIRAIAQAVKPAAIIAVDALAAGDTARLGNTIQISNTGIAPGSGVQNRRKALNRNTLGAEVIAVGIPTVVDAQTLARDLRRPGEPPTEESTATAPLMITPRDIDVLISHGSRLLALIINKALQPHLDWQEIQYLMS